MSSVKEYFSGIGEGISSLVKGMGVTGKEFFTKKITEEYPDNRATLKIGERFRGTLEFVYDEEGNHKCIACGLCQMSCPNGTIHIETKMVEMPDGKKKKKLARYMYDLGTCTFCQMCVTACPHHAIRFTNEFEHAVFTRSKLVKQLNYLPEKEIVAPVAKPAAAPVEKPAAAPAAKPAVAEPAPAPVAPKTEPSADNEPKQEKN